MTKEAQMQPIAWLLNDGGDAPDVTLSGRVATAWREQGYDVQELFASSGRAVSNAKEDELDRLLDAAQDDMLWGGDLALKASDAFSWLLKKGAIGRVERISRRAALAPKPKVEERV